MASDINDATGTPHTLSLGDVLADIELAPAQIGELLRSLAYPHLGGPHDEMARSLLDHANAVADPATYGNAPDPNADNPQARWTGAAQAQSSLPPTGGVNEPSWMADARAAGWNNPNAPVSTRPQGGTPQEPAWMASARAAGWNPEQSGESRPTGVPSPTPGGSPDNPHSATFNVASSGSRHWDDSRGQWIDNATGQPVDVGRATTSMPPQPSAPPQ